MTHINLYLVNNQYNIVFVPNFIVVKTYHNDKALSQNEKVMRYKKRKTGIGYRIRS